MKKKSTVMSWLFWKKSKFKNQTAKTRKKLHINVKFATKSNGRQPKRNISVKSIYDTKKFISFFTVSYMCDKKMKS